MRTYAYAAHLAGADADGVTVTFRDLPEAITGAATAAAARTLAADALDAVILHRLALGEAVPAPSPLQPGEEWVMLDPATAARAALAAVMAEQQVTDAALAERLGRSLRSVRRLLGGAGTVRTDVVLQALAALGRPAALTIQEG
ncbi:type II toxin-antitoxin system HicB family antitoxin [Caulobacter sp. S45]|uniref:type II toxin-antitoxin system HicB family antitoxin n=1 Tax=Caulobacter sp. S45 TaxID=1641861 RepID=UPI0015765280|nr:type II toxin-antitoxin system HicB family antitoxin [Caulobacter sp. S45]